MRTRPLVLHPKAGAPFRRRPAAKRPCFRLAATTLFLFISSQAASTAVAQRARAPEYFKAFRDFSNEGRFTRVVLRNGLTVLIEEDHVAPLATIVTYVPNDGLSPEALAAAAVLGRVYLRSSTTFREAYDAGGLLEVSSDQDRNAYFLTLPSSEVEKGLELQSHFLLPPKIEEASASSALAEVRDEARTGRGNRAGEARDEVLQLAGMRPRSPSFGDLSAPASSDPVVPRLTAVHERTHRPQATIVVIAGSVFSERLLKKVAELYGPLKGASEPVRLNASKTAAAEGPLRYRFLSRGQGAHYVLTAAATSGWRAPDFDALQIAFRVLAVGEGSLLNRHVLGEKSVRDADVTWQGRGSGGRMVALLDVDSARIDAAEALWMAQLKRLADGGFSDADVARAKALYWVDHYRSLEDLSSRAELLARYESLGSYKDRDRLSKRLAAIGKKEIQAVAKRCFRPESQSVLEFFPEGGEQRRFDSASYLETVRVLVDAVPDNRAEDARTGIGSGKTEPISFPANFKLDYQRTDLQRTSILRGPEIYYLAQHDVPLVDVGIFFVGGRRDENAQNAGITGLLLHSLLAGGGGAKSLPFHMLESWGGQVSVVNETDFFGYRATVLSSQLNPFLEAVVDWLRQAGIVKENVERERRRMLSVLERNEVRGDLNWGRRQLFADDPYGRSGLGTPESLAGLDVKDLLAWKKSHIDKFHPWLAIRGDIAGTSFLQPLISKLSGSRYEAARPGVRRARSDEGPQPEDTAVADELLLSADEGSVIIGMRGPPLGSEDSRIIDLLGNLLLGADGQLEVLLQEPVQDPPVRLVYDAGISAGAIFFLSRTDPQTQDQLMDRLTPRIGRLAQAEIRPSAWNKAAVLAITQFQRRKLAGMDYLMELSRQIAAGNGADYERSAQLALKNARSDDLRRMAQRYFAVAADDD